MLISFSRPIKGIVDASWKLFACLSCLWFFACLSPALLETAFLDLILIYSCKTRFSLKYNISPFEYAWIYFILGLLIAVDYWSFVIIHLLDCCKGNLAGEKIKLK